MARPRKRLETELSEFLDSALKRKGITHNTFSQRVGLKPSTLSDLKLRRETPAPSRAVIHHWAAVLGLTQAEEDALFDLVQLAHAPLYVQNVVSTLRSPRRVAESRDPSP
jgi:transcriptional regulator with XRE-family HTH domain